MDFKSSVLSYFNALEDPRNGNNLTHPFINIVSIAILATICGADDWVAVTAYGQAKQKWLEMFVDLSSGIPSIATPSPFVTSQIRAFHSENFS